MAKYRFPEQGVEMTDPNILIHGSVGTRFEEGIPLEIAFAEVLLVTESSRLAILLEDTTIPNSWSVKDLQSWVMVQMKKHEVS